MNKITRKSLSIFIAFSVCLGAAAGVIVWALLKVMSIGIHLLWDVIPANFNNQILYAFAVCLLGGLMIGL